MEEPQSSLEEKNSPTILKADFSSGLGSSIFTSILLEFLEESN